MPKYRLLNKAELESLEKEFIDYLVLNSITSDEWVTLKNSDEQKAQSIIDLFSDVVFEKVLREVEYLDHYDQRSIKTFKCGAEQIHLIGMDTSDSRYDFTTKKGIEEAQLKPPKDLEIYKSSKRYHPFREMEIFKMLQSGCQISNGQIYRSLDV